MARTFSWIGPAGGAYDGAGNWADITTGTAETTAAVPGSLDTAFFVAPAHGLTGQGLAGTLEIAAAVSLVSGTLQFGNLVVNAATLSVGAGATLRYQPALRTANQAAVVIGGAGGVLAVGGVGASVAVDGGANETDYLQLLSGDAVRLTQGGSLDADVVDLAGDGASAVVDGAGTLAAATRLSTDWLAIGDGATASAIWRNHATASIGLLTVGFGELFGAGAGTLLLQSGATMAASLYAAIGYAAGDVGSVTIDGASLSSAGLFVGNGGTGALTIEHAATVRTQAEAGDSTQFAGAIANQAGSAGSVVVSGAGSDWTIAGRFDIGAAGPGTLDVTGGAVVRSTVGPIAVAGGGGLSYDASIAVLDATVLVQGPGSTLAAGSGPLWIGEQGTAELTVADGGSVSAAAPATGVAAVALGFAGGNGTLLVTGAGSLLTAGGELEIGIDGTARLGIADGGRVAVSGDLDVGGLGGEVRLVTVDAGTLAVAGNLAAADGTITIGDGGLVTFGHAVTLGPDALIALSGGAMEVGGSSNARAGALVIDAGADLSGAGQVLGTVVNDGSISATGGLELAELQGPGVLRIAQSASVEVGTLESGTIDFAGAGTLLLDQSASGQQAAQLEFGEAGGTIDLLGQQATGATFSGGDLVVNIAGGVPLLFGLAVPPPPGQPGVVSDGAGGTDIVLPCFARGTRIRTQRGEVAVQDLRAGDVAVTADGRRRRILWVGQRTLDCRLHPRPQDVMPVRVLRGAFAPGVPARDLVLSPDHALLCGGLLIPVRYLQNGRTVVQEAAGRMVYYHVELATHDILLAEGLAAESYLDTGNRAAFGGRGAATRAPPQAARLAWRSRGCARLVLHGPPVTRARRHLLRRAAALGHVATPLADLRLVADGARLPALVTGTRWRAFLPRGATTLRLQSRSWVPAHTSPAETDTRRLGVALGGLWLDGRRASLDSPGLVTGWHTAEPGWRWTDGDAALHPQGAREIAFDVAMTGSYWASRPPARH